MRYTWLILFILLVCSCKDKYTGIIHPKEMIKIVADLNMAEVYSTLSYKDTSHIVKSKNMDSLAAYYNEIFAHYNVTRKLYDKSMNWYKAHPEELDSIYAAVIPALSHMDTSSATKHKK